MLVRHKFEYAIFYLGKISKLDVGLDAVRRPRATSNLSLKHSTYQNIERRKMSVEEVDNERSDSLIIKL
ncbi:MAG: hypothetical protein ACOYKC_00360 [Anaerolineaceae bacterium]